MNNRMSAKLVGLFLLVILALVGLAIYITAINVNDGKQYERIVLSQAQQQYESRTIPFKRGDIRDRNGTILATSDKVYNLILDCAIINTTETKTKENGVVTVEQPYREPTVKALVDLYGLDEAEIYSVLDDEDTKDSRYYILVENMPASAEDILEEYTDTTSDKHENMSDDAKEERNSVQGIWFEEDYLRVYPMNSQASDLIGFSDAQNNANYGIEGYYSDILNGTDGRKFGYYNDDANVEQTIIDPVAGKNVISTIDVNIQQIIRSAMEKYIEEYTGPNGESAAENIGVIVMNPNTGEVLGMDSSNWYDLNNPLIYTTEEFKAMSDEEYETVQKDLEEMWKNFCISDSFEPGSTFKPMTVAAAMEMALTDNDDIYYCDGLEEISESTLHCVIYPGEHGEVNLESALKVSCNDALMQIGRKLGVEGILKYQELFNFGMKTRLDLPGENSGVLYTAETMGDVELATTSFGQGFTCTMIQEAAAFSAVVNGGYYYKPRVVSAITDSSGAVTEHMNAVMERQVVSNTVSNQIREWLKGVMETGGSGEIARVDGYSLAGKTGTAQKIDSETKAYEGDYIVSYIGCAPAENPEVVVYVVVDTPNAEDQGSSIYAQKIAREIYIELLPYMNIFPEDAEAAEAFIAQLRETEAAEKAAREQAALNPEGQETEETAAEQQSEEVPAEGSGETADAQEGSDETAPPAEAQQSEALPAEEQQTPVLDTDMPGPPEEVQDETAEDGGNDLYSDGIPNEE